MTGNRQTRDRRLRRAAAYILAIAWALLVCVSLEAAAPQDGGNGPQQVPATQTQSPQSQPPERVARLIRDLGSDSYLRRQAAGEQLKALGSVSILPLEVAKDSADPEVRIRAQDLLQELKLSALWEATPVTIAAENRAAADLFREIARQSGNGLTLGGGDSGVNDVPLTANFERTPFWQVVDDLCRQSGNKLAKFTDRTETRLGISRGEQSVAPVAYSGPLRGQVLSVKRAFSEELNFTGRPARAHTFQLMLQLEWEERFRLIGYRQAPRVVEAVTESGEVLELTARAVDDWVAASPGSRQVTFKLELSPPPIAAQRIARLRLAWEVSAAGDFAEVIVPDLGTSKIYEAQDARITLESHIIRPYQRQELQVRIDRVFPDWQPREMFYLENEVQLLDADGKQLKLEQADWSSQSTGLMVRARYLGSTAGPPKTVRVKYPRLRDRREIEIEFADIPLPRTLPDFP